MKRKFNVTGTCIPEKHYMVNIDNKLNEIMKLVEDEEYFIINRPRQYGKTTALYLLNKTLMGKEEYLPIKISFEAIDSESYNEVKSFLNTLIAQIRNYFKFNKNKDMFEFTNKYYDKVNSMHEFSDFITNIVEYTGKKVVLIIDEIDKSSNNQLFLDFLGMLRNKYLLRNEGQDFTFHSVILAGVHDVKSLKIKIRPNEEHKYNSPWNIASDFDVDMSFSSKEIMTMLDNYCEDKKVQMDKEYFAKKLYYYTSGYPFLVSKLCKIIDEKIMTLEIKNSKVPIWKNEFLERAVKILLKESNTNFDSLIKNLENNKELSELVCNIVIDGREFSYNADNSTINIGLIYGIFKENEGKLKINNRIYEQRIYDYKTSIVETSIDFDNYNFKDQFIAPKETLDLEKVLLKFQQFMKKEHSQKLRKFLENDGRLVFLAFLSPIINGTGFAFKEVQTSEEKRLDITITYGKKMSIIETKRWRGEAAHEKGLKQLWDYLEINDLDYGYLLIFDFRREENRDRVVEEIEIEGKKIFSVWV